MRIAEAGVLVGLMALAAALPAAAQEAPPPVRSEPPAEPAADPTPGPPARPAPAPRVAALRAPARVEHGEAVALSGRVAPAGRQRVEIEQLRDGRWVRLVAVRSDARGRFATRVRLAGPANLRARVAGPLAGRVIAVRRNVVVSRRLSLAVERPEFGSIAGRPIPVRGAVVPARQGERVVLEGSRDGGAYRAVARLRVNGGRVSGRVVPTGGGTWRWRLRAEGAAGPGLSAATEARRVHAANPHGVPASAPRYLVQKLSEAQLYYYEHGRVVRVLPVVFGKPSTPTPIGRFRVYSKTVGPGPAFGPLAIWYHGNYGIHGTNQEYLLEREWRYYSKGCTRNYNANIRWLWDRIPVGTPVLNIR